MIVNQITTPIREFLEKELKEPASPTTKGGTIFSPDEIDYLTRYSAVSIYEFMQEGETDKEFYEQFNKWLHEGKQIEGYCNVYVFVYLRQGQTLKEDEFAYFERNVAECFEKNPIWLYEVNYRLRFKLRIRLLLCSKMKFRRVIRKGCKNPSETAGRPKVKFRRIVQRKKQQE